MRYCTVTFDNGKTFILATVKNNNGVKRPNRLLFKGYSVKYLKYCKLKSFTGANVTY